MPVVGITGASGFVGRRLVADFAARDWTVRAFSRTPFPVAAGVEWCAMPELTIDADWTGAFDGVDVVVHCAARVHVMDETSTDPLTDFRRVNRDGTLATARAAAAAGVGHFVFLSSIKVNGEGTPRDRPYCANDMPAPMDPYGVSKREAEDALFALAAEGLLRVSIIRPPLVYGTGVRANMAALMRLAVLGLPVPFGAIDNKRSLVFVGNLSSLVQRLVTARPEANLVYLASDGTDLSTGELYAAMTRAAGHSAMLIPIPEFAMTAALAVLGRRDYARRLFDSLVVDIAPTCAALGWEPPFSVEEGIGETMRAFLAERRA